EREGDIPLLAMHFAHELGGPEFLLAPEVVARFEEYAWPGNVRELRNAVARIFALGDDALATKANVSAPGAATRAEAGDDDPSPDSHLDDWISDLLADEVCFPIARRRMLDRFEKRFLERVLAAHGDSVQAAADASGLAARY